MDWIVNAQNAGRHEYTHHKLKILKDREVNLRAAANRSSDHPQNNINQKNCQTLFMKKISNPDLRGNVHHVS